MYYYLMSLENPRGYSQCYALTLTLKPNYYRYTLEEQYEYLNNEIKLRLQNNILISLIAEITTSYNIHAHGIIKISSNIKNAKKYVYDCVRQSKIIGHIYVKDIDNYDKWLLYIIKEIKKTKETLNCKDPLIIDQCDVIPIEIYFAMYQTGKIVEK